MAGIFKAYDIRGIYPSQINEEAAYQIAKATIASLCGPSGPAEIAVGHDMRTSSPSLYESFIAGARDAGADVFALGECSTPLLYFAARDRHGAMITASHNPKEYNGIKLQRHGPSPVSMGSGLEGIETRVANKSSVTYRAPGRCYADSVLHRYMHALWKQSGAMRIAPMSVAIDAGSGMAGMVTPHIFADLPIRMTPMNFEPDGTFPVHEANPLKKENTKDLCARVKALGCDLGLAYDGDADRVFFIDERGTHVPSEQIICLLSQEFLRLHPGSTIVYSVNCSKIVPETIASLGGTAVRERVGVSLMKARMRKEDAIFGSEVSGHHTFRDFYNIDSADFAALTVMRIMSEKGKRLSELIAPYKKYAKTDELNWHDIKDIPCTLARIENAYAGAKTDRLDGLTVEFPDWWCNIRPSNTEPILRAVVEAQDDAMLAGKVAELEGLIMQKP